MHDIFIFVSYKILYFNLPQNLKSILSQRERERERERESLKNDPFQRSSWLDGRCDIDVDLMFNETF